LLLTGPVPAEVVDLLEVEPALQVVDHAARREKGGGADGWIRRAEWEASVYGS
jgi:hypothetical protein